MSKCYYGCVTRFESFGAAARVTSRHREAAVLATPPIPRIVPDGVFDDFGWCESDELAWRRTAGAWDGATHVDGADPARMVFVIGDHVPPAERQWVPRELARLHAFGLGLGDEEALAPWAIDDATDGLHARRVRPGDLFWLAADNLNALFWGLHDWAHFHNHGPFAEVAWTELQCDASALVWLWQNREVIVLDDAAWERVRLEVEALCARRFEREGAAMPRGVLASERVHALVTAARAMRS